ncbi:MAG: DUF3422 domain-containing protein [Mariprofundaceae bacterium]|nr:DUF3422 domain-containing protein [Mariprofundaceae bacterium]
MNSLAYIYNHRMSFSLPPDFAARIPLNDELHVHPYESLTPPERVVSIAMLAGPQHCAAEACHLQALCRHFGEQAPTDPERWRIDLGRLRVKVENHQEYTRYKITRKLDAAPQEDPFGESPLDLLPEGWLADLPGKLLVAMDISIMPYPEGTSHRKLLDEFSPHFDETTLSASQVGRSANLAITDFKIREDGMTRMLIFSKARLPSQIGRLTHRLVAMETYRMLALLALPEAKHLLTELPQADARLTELTHAISDGDGADDEALMHQLTTLAASIEKLVATHYRRFSATHAYFDMVFKLLGELREQQVETVPSLGGILGRRLDPARTTCNSVSHWLDQLARRVGKTTGLLGTRIDVEHAKQNREMLSAMNRRFLLQLRLQQAAELLSIAIFTYYTVNLLDYVVQELAVLAGKPLDSLLVKAVSAPLLALAAFLFIRRLRSKREI